jgi:hypothetical protein
VPCESDLAVYGLFQPGLEGVADQSDDQPTKWNMLRLRHLPQVVEEIV